jgi:uncharacterized protein YgbK (DUF1537 family)
MGILLGAIADDLTGATDLALMLARGGMRTIQVVGVPDAGSVLPDADAVVIALKSRTNPVGEAVAQSRDAARALKAAGARQILFKYCSTFDSTDDGNIGPVAEALLDLLGSNFTIACPAFPANQRTIYKGHLFVGDLLLSDSPMKDHPLTPMRDANLVRVLGRQVRSKVGLVAQATVGAGAVAIADAFAVLQRDGHRFAIVDAISNDDLMAIGRAIRGMKLVTGGSGIALGIPDNFRAEGLLTANAGDSVIKAGHGRRAILAGSCSVMTRKQVAHAKAAGLPSLQLDPLAISEGSMTADGVVEWIRGLPVDAVPLVYSSADPAEVLQAQEKLGREAAGTVVEHLLGTVASQLVADGFDQLVVAGGETSGAVVEALGVRQLRIGQEIDPGVPWTESADSEKPIALALKSGNFGTEDFFTKAWGVLK